MWTLTSQSSCNEEAPGYASRKQGGNSGNELGINFEQEGPPTSSKDSDSEPEVEADRMPVFNNIFDIFKSPFAENIWTFHFKAFFVGIEYRIPVFNIFDIYKLPFLKNI